MSPAMRIGPAPQAVDPRARRQAEEDERQELDGAEQGDLERCGLEQRHGHEGQRQQADLGPELADRLGRPEADEVAVVDDAAGLGSHGAEGSGSVGPWPVAGRAGPLASKGARRIGAQRLRGATARGGRSAGHGHRSRAWRLPAGPHERRQPQPIRVHDRRRARAGQRGPGAARRGGHPRHRHGRPRGRAPAHRRGRRGARSSRSAATTMDDAIEHRPARSASGWPRATTCRSTSTRARRSGRSARSWPTCDGASTRASRRRSASAAASPISVRRGCIRRPAPWPSAPARSSSPTTSTSTPTTSSWPSASPGASANPAAACPRSRPTASRSTSRSAAIRRSRRSR